MQCGLSAKSRRAEGEAKPNGRWLVAQQHDADGRESTVAFGKTVKPIQTLGDAFASGRAI